MPAVVTREVSAERISVGAEGGPKSLRRGFMWVVMVETMTET